ncbi:RDD family protein [Nocardia crassostreae]|uniref:RDD family protein n=1 Tax=Nocardia crassostreae TaxID=53428 RepID=UPI0008362EC0|nr:RDD family protein [Nocardia crassostreae]
MDAIASAPDIARGPAASGGRKFAAAVVDVLILVSVWFVLSAIALGEAAESATRLWKDSHGLQQIQVVWPGGMVWTGLVTIVVAIVYFLGLRGRTLGRLAAGITPDGLIRIDSEED